VHGIELIRDNQLLACMSRVRYIVRWINRYVEAKNTKLDDVNNLTAMSLHNCDEMMTQMMVM
jgi:hypothetical protein